MCQDQIVLLFLLSLLAAVIYFTFFINASNLLLLK